MRIAYCLESVRVGKHSICCAPMHVAMEGDLEQSVYPALTLEALKVCHVLSRHMNFDDKSSNSSNNVKVVTLDLIFRQCWIKFPDGGSGVDVNDVGDNTHDSSDSEIDNMHKAWEAMLVGVEGVNFVRLKSRFNIVAHHIIVAGIVCSHAKKLHYSISVNAGMIKWYAHLGTLAHNDTSLLA